MEDLRVVRIAQARGIFGYRVKHPLNRGVRDEAQHLRSGSLLHRRLGKALTRVGDLPPICLEFLFEIGAGLASSTNARLRFCPVKLATSRSALRHFDRQGALPSASRMMYSAAALQRRAAHQLGPRRPYK